MKRKEKRAFLDFMMTIITNLSPERGGEERKVVIKEFAFEHHDDRLQDQRTLTEKE